MPKPVMHPLIASMMNEPVMLAKGTENVLEANLNALATSPDYARLIQADAKASSDDGFWFAPDDWRAAYRPYVVKGGSLYIPVRGTLLHDFGYQFGSWATGYTYIEKAFMRGMDDPEVNTIIFVENSGGGMVAGCFQAADRMYARRDEKRVIAVADESAYSAAYAIFSIAAETWVSRTGGVGSIGVLSMHVDVSKAMDNAGYKITFIDAPEEGFKVDGNAYEPLSDTARARTQARVNELYEVFVSTVARNRGLEEQAVRDTKALCFTATEAVSNGLADKIGSLDDAVSALDADMSSSTTGDEEMTTPPKADAAADQTAAIEAARNEGRAEGRAEGATAERERIFAILNHAEAADRPALARSFAEDPAMSAESAGKYLPAAAKETQAAPEGVGGDQSQQKAPVGSVPFAQAMEQGGNPEVEATNQNEGGQTTDEFEATKQAAMQSGLPGMRSAPAAK